MVLRFLKEIGVMLAAFIVVLVCSFILVFLFDIVADAIFEYSFPDNYLFYENQGDYYWLYFITLFVCGDTLVTYRGKLKEIWQIRKKTCIAVLLAVIFLGYHFLVSVACVTETGILSRTLLNPGGTTYAFEEIDKIKTGFGDKKGIFFTPEYEKLGNFYYKIYIDDREIVFHVPSVNPDLEGYEDYYLTLEELDQELKSMGIPKESSSAGHTFCDYDAQYVEGFLRIIGEN